MLLGGAYPDRTYREKPNRVNVEVSFPESPCTASDISGTYQLKHGSYCFVATEGGASCGVSYWGE